MTFEKQLKLILRDYLIDQVPSVEWLSNAESASTPTGEINLYSAQSPSTSRIIKPSRFTNQYQFEIGVSATANDKFLCDNNALDMIGLLLDVFDRLETTGVAATSMFEFGYIMPTIYKGFHFIKWDKLTERLNTGNQMAAGSSLFEYNVKLYYEYVI